MSRIPSAVTRPFGFLPVITLLHLALPGFSLYAQSPQGTIVGTVTDPSRAVVAQVKVLVTNQDTGVTRELTANTAGEYSAPFLPVGTYSVRANTPGFKSFEMKDVRLATGQTVRVDVHLEVGDVTTGITVEGSDVPLIQTEKAVLVSSMGAREIRELPSGRYFMNYLRFATGASGSSGTVFNGGYRLDVNFVMDGVNIKDRVRGEYTSDIAGPSVEAMEEVSLKSSTAGTDTGLGTSEVHMITKSGTNQFHGNLFEYYRGNFAEARNRFNSTNKIPRTVRNQFGGSLGGPIVRNRTFFFFNFEGLEARSGSTSRITAPTTLMRGGNFSEYPGLVLRDPSTSTVIANQLPFPDDTIPASRISPTALTILDYFNYPTANQPGLTNNYLFSLSFPKNDRQYTLKLDHTLSSKDTLSGRLWQDWTHTAYLGGYDLKSNVGLVDYNDTNISATWTRILTPSATNEARFGWYNFPRDLAVMDPGQDLNELFGIQGITIVDPYIQNSGPQFSFGGVGGVQAIGNNTSWPQVLRTRTYAFNDTFSLVKSVHSLRAGVQLLFVHVPYFSVVNTRGALTFTGTNTSWWSSGYAFADFLLGTPNTAAKADPTPVRNLRERDYGFFVTDDWKVMHNLTLTLGLRYDYISPLREANNVGLSGLDLQTMSVVVNSSTLPSGFDTRIGAAGGLPVVTAESLGLGNALQKPDRNNFTPRMGIAWRPKGNDSMVFRAGYGIYNAETCMLFSARQTYSPPWTYARSFRSSTSVLSLNTPFQAGSAQTPSITSFDRNIRSPYTQQWNATLEKTLAPDIGWRVSYVGSKGTNLWQPLNVDQATNVTRSGSSYIYTYPIPQLSGATTWFSMANSSYHSLQTEVRKRWSEGFEFTGNWTWAKSLDNNIDSSTPLNSYNLRADRGDSIYAHRHTVSIWGIYEFPFGRGKTFLRNAPRWMDAVVGGWRLASANRWYSGRFVSVSANTGGRADRVLGVDMFSNVPAGRWFNPAAFSVPFYDPENPTIVFGNSARNILPTPSQLSMDMALSKTFHVREGHRIVVRAESFNMPNHPNPGVPATNISDAANVGKITSAGKARNFQWSARYEF